MTTETTNRKDIYSRVTAAIIGELEQGARPWHKPWSMDHAGGRIARPLRHNGVPYQGINILLLWSAAEIRDFTNPHWLTYKQARELGGFVRKGEHGSPIVFADTFTKTVTNDKGEKTEETIPFLKEYSVFNVEQCEGLPAHLRETEIRHLQPLQRIERATKFFESTQADIRHGGDRAFYLLDQDYIRIPTLCTFRDAESYTATVAHELTHWTGHPARLARPYSKNRFGQKGYAFEELIAELGAAFVCADLEITPEVQPDHAAYVSDWLKLLHGDKRAIFSAAAQASRAVEFLHGLQPKQEQKAA